MADREHSPTLAKLADESPKDCTLHGAERSWFCGAERYEDAILGLETQLAGAVGESRMRGRVLEIALDWLTKTDQTPSWAIQAGKALNRPGGQ